MRGDLTVRVDVAIHFAAVPILCILAVAVEVLTAEGYGDGYLPTVGWWSWIVFGLVAIPATALCMLGSMIMQVILANWWIRSSQKKNCESLLILILASVLFEIRTLRRINPARRLRLAWNLEWAASQIMSNLLPVRSLAIIASGDWLSRRVAGWAEALRYMQRELVAPVPGGQAKLEARLRNEIRCLAAGDLGALAWRQPPSTSTNRASLPRKAVSAIRVIVVAGLPLTAVLAAQAVIHVPNEIFRWAGIVSAAWFLLYTILSIDPALRDKIEAARSLTGMIDDARRIR